MDTQISKFPGKEFLAKLATNETWKETLDENCVYQFKKTCSAKIHKYCTDAFCNNCHIL